MNETQAYMAKLGELVRELNRCSNAEKAAYRAEYEARRRTIDAMVARYNADMAYREHLHNRPCKEPENQL